MIPRLFNSDATVFDSEGLGRLKEVTRCIVTERTDGTFELEMELLARDPLFPNLKVGNIIACIPNKTQGRQAFCIESIKKEIDGTIEIYATHICQYRGKLIPVIPFTSTDLSDSFTQLIANSQESNPFNLLTDKTSNVPMNVREPHTFRELLKGTEGSVSDTYVGEWYFDNFDLSFLAHRGRDNGVRILYGKNMTDFVMEEAFSWSKSVTGVLPYWKDEDSIVVGDVQRSQYEYLYKIPRTVPVDFSEKIEEKPTKAELETFAQSYVNSLGLDQVHLSVSFDALSSKSDNIQIGDTVHIINSLYNVDLESRVVGTVFDVLKEEYDAIEIGDLKESINDSIESLNDTDKPMIYQTGDIIKFATADDQVLCTGIITNTHYMIFQLPMNRPVLASGVQFNHLYMTIRNVNGDLLLSGVDIANTQGYTVNGKVAKTSGLRIYIGTAVDLGLINTPCTVAVSMPTEIEFI